MEDTEKTDKNNYNTPLVVIRCITYNHEPYIRDALEGFVMQKTDFPFVAIVHDDASTDGTAAIIREYADKYPDIIKPIYETENQYSKHDGSLRRIMNEACNATGAKYIAMCEGDDYWTDPLKLQKQVDFLESHPEYSFCCHRFKIYDNRNGEWHNEYAHKLYNDTNIDIDVKVFTKTWITQPLTAVIRLEYFLDYYNFSRKFKLSRDVHLFYYLLLRGKGVSLNRQMGVYRWHNGGIDTGMNLGKRFATSYEIYKELYEATHDVNIFPVYYDRLLNMIAFAESPEVKQKALIEARHFKPLVLIKIRIMKKQIRMVFSKIFISLKIGFKK